MRFNSHSHLAGSHATLSASSPAWTNYDVDKFDAVYRAKMAAQNGTEMHALAAECIRLRVKVADIKQTFYMYVNDAIDFLMTPEVVLLAFQPYAFGTADAVAFRDNILRIHDLKTGLGECDVRQLEIYAAYFCIEYKKNPFDLEIYLRFYQNDEFVEYIGDPGVITHHMEHAKALAKRIPHLRKEALDADRG